MDRNLYFYWKFVSVTHTYQKIHSDGLILLIRNQTEFTVGRILFDLRVSTYIVYFHQEMDASTSDHTQINVLTYDTQAKFCKRLESYIMNNVCMYLMATSQRIKHLIKETFVDWALFRGKFSECSYIHYVSAHMCIHDPIYVYARTGRSLEWIS